MDSPFDLVFDSTGFTARVIFVDAGFELVCAICGFSEGAQQSLALSFPDMVAVPTESLRPVGHSRYQTDLNLATLARDAGMSRSRFVERFKRLVGTSPHHYLVNYRIGIAQDLLAKRMPVKTVAQRVGYGTTASFVRSFKQVVGIPPGAWAK